MKDLRPFPRPVEIAFPPKAIVSAERTALLPPKYISVELVIEWQTWLRHTSIVTYRHGQLGVPFHSVSQEAQTDDEIDLGPKLEGQARVAHEVMHLD